MIEVTEWTRSWCKAAIVAWMFHGCAAAADSSEEQLYQARLDALLKDVANPERSFDFVEAAVAVGDLRGAAASLERILLIDPQLANIEL